MISRIDLLRHGETEDAPRFRGSIDDRLTERGWAQMWSAVTQDTPPWDRIISSPLMRCASFARALGERYSMPFALDERIREMHFGAWEGRTAAELMAADAEALSRFWNDPMRYTPPDAEPLASFEARVLSAWHDIIAKHAGGKILLVTHGGTIRVILCHVLPRPVERLLAFEVAHAALLRIRIEQACGQIRTTLLDGKNP